MIAPDSTSYPVLAVIQHFGLSPVERRIAYDVAHRIRLLISARRPPADIYAEAARTLLTHEQGVMLVMNMARAGAEHGWGR